MEAFLDVALSPRQNFRAARYRSDRSFTLVIELILALDLFLAANRGLPAAGFWLYSSTKLAWLAFSAGLPGPWRLVLVFRSPKEFP